MTDIDEFLAKLPYKLVAAPRRASELISDPKDHPIMNAAILAGVDIIISGDKHFLELELEHPKAMSAAEYLDEIE